MTQPNLEQQRGVEEIKGALRGSVEGFVPAWLRDMFENEIDQIADGIRDMIERVVSSGKESHSLPLEKRVKTTLEAWVEQKYRNFAYPRYKALMKQLGKEKNVQTLTQFASAHRTTSRTTYQRFRKIEQLGIKKGSEVVFNPDNSPRMGIIYVVIDIQTDCNVRLKQKGAQGPKNKDISITDPRLLKNAPALGM